MRVNVYAEEMTERVEIVTKEIKGQKFTGLRLYLELPVTKYVKGQADIVQEIKGPFIHGDGDDDSSAVTFWGKSDLRNVLKIMMTKLHEHYHKRNDKDPMRLKERIDYVKLQKLAHNCRDSNGDGYLDRLTEEDMRSRLKYLASWAEDIIGKEEE